MTGFTFGQPFGHGLTEQSTVTPGRAGASDPPAAGQPYTLKLERYDRWRLVAVTFDLETDSNAADRYVQVQYLDGTGTPIVRDIAAVAQAATKTVHYSGAKDGLIAQDALTNVTASFRLSGLWLEAGQSVKIDIGAVQVGDQLSNIRMTFDRSLTPGDGTQDLHDARLEG